MYRVISGIICIFSFLLTIFASWFYYSFKVPNLDLLSKVKLDSKSTGELTCDFPEILFTALLGCKPTLLALAWPLCGCPSPCLGWHHTPYCLTLLGLPSNQRSFLLYRCSRSTQVLTGQAGLLPCANALFILSEFWFSRWDTYRHTYNPPSGHLPCGCPPPLLRLWRPSWATPMYGLPHFTWALICTPDVPSSSATLHCST